MRLWLSMELAVDHKIAFSSLNKMPIWIKEVISYI